MKPEQLEALVRKMRELGVTKVGDVELGPVPTSAVKEPTQAEEREKAMKVEERQRDIMFAASHVKPVLRRVK